MYINSVALQLNCVVKHEVLAKPYTPRIFVVYNKVVSVYYSFTTKAVESIGILQQLCAEVLFLIALSIKLLISARPIVSGKLVSSNIREANGRDF